LGSIAKAEAKVFADLIQFFQVFLVNFSFCSCTAVELSRRRSMGGGWVYGINNPSPKIEQKKGQQPIFGIHTPV
jgi:hypothetical protein